MIFSVHKTMKKKVEKQKKSRILLMCFDEKIALTVVAGIEYASSSTLFFEEHSVKS